MIYFDAVYTIRQGFDMGFDSNRDSQQSNATAYYGMETVSSISDTDTEIIVHVDCDCFYAACEQRRRPVLQGEPVIVGMGYEDGKTVGAVATASYEAREYGVESAMPIDKALQCLPKASVLPNPGVETWSDVTGVSTKPSDVGFYCPVDMEFYEEVSQSVRDILTQYSDVVEPISIDEAYLDISTQTTWSDVSEYVEELKHVIAVEVGIPVSVGVAPTKSAAKVASDKKKPDGKVIVTPGGVKEFFAPLSVEEIHGIGPVAADTLQDMGIETGDDIATTDPSVLHDALGAQGVEAHQRARGHDPRDVTEPENAKSISNESSLGDGTTSESVKQNVVDELLSKVHERVVEKDVLYRTVGVKVVEPPFEVHTRERSLNGPVKDYDLLESIVKSLLEEFSDVKARKLGVRVSNLSFTETTQPSLDKWETEDAPPGELSQSQDTKNDSSHETAQLNDSDADTPNVEQSQMLLTDFDSK